MKKNAFDTCFSKLITIFVATLSSIKTLWKLVKDKMGGIFIAQVKKFCKFFFASGFVHSWMVPILHAVLWAVGLLIAKSAKELFPALSDEVIEVIQFLAIFVVLFVEVLIVLLDIYVVQKANYFASKFVLFVILLLIVLLGTSISVGGMFVLNENLSKLLLYVILFSSALKFIEILLANNPQWYIVKIPEIFDARGIYIKRQLS